MDAAALTALGRDLHARLRTFLDAPLGPDATPLEIAQAALDDVERQVQPAPSGRRVFPHTDVTLRVRTPEDAWPAVEAVLADFGARVLARLAELRCEAPRELQVRVTCEPADGGRGFVVEYRRDRTTPPVASPALHVTVIRGAAVEPAWTFSEGAIAIGRLTDGPDDAERPRRNHLAFLDVQDGVTETVGRAHARVRFDPAARAYRVFDEGSRNGTAVLREGEVIPVPRRDPRGVRLRSGDEIRLGRAVVHIVIDG